MLGALDPNQPAPSWVPYVALAVPVVIVLAVAIPLLRVRARNKRAMRATNRGIREQSVPLGAGAQIPDGAIYHVDALRKALAVRPEDHGPTADEPHDSGWAGTMLGLKSRISYATNLLEPHVYWGTRRCGQVFVRVGPDEKIAGSTMLGSNRHLRQIVVVRVAAPAFVLDVVGGKPTCVSGAASPALDRVLARMAPNEAIWQDLAVQAGPEGIVSSRDAIATPDFWIYDLWLLETIARELDLEPLASARLGPAWKVPYGAGRGRIAVS